MSNALVLEQKERTIDALARSNNIIKSLFHYDKPVSFLIITLAIQKIKISAHKKGLVIISRSEVNSLISGKDKTLGINKLMESIRLDLELHNFFNLYSPNSGLKDIRQALIQKTAFTKDLFQDLVIHFDENIFDIFKSKKNYTIQSLNQLRDCNENQTTVIYALTQPYAKPNSPPLSLNILELRLYLRIADGAYTAPKTLTMRVKKICNQVTKKTDINLTVTPIKKNGTTGVTVGYLFYSEFKNQKTDNKIIELKPISSRQQLSDWGVSKKQIDIWIANLTPKTINDAIKQTLERPERKNKKNNAGGYIYSILGGKQLQLTKHITDKEAVGCLRNFNLTDSDIKKAQQTTTNNKHVLTAVTNKCLRELENETIDTGTVRQFFIDELDCVVRELKGNSNE